ncbi:MAG: septal ring lytic transglycosylase RlpA family protein [Bryobacteraceae bacterium]|nr:septal ring lytic transglycosylase RlpA family protein [Bryobacteraceae bacterium]
MSKRGSALCFVTLAAVFSAACARKKPAPRPPPPPPLGWTESGIASWYGHPYHGRKAANGETYDMDKLTAAHRTLPFGALVEVENRDNGRKTTVRITDRGPFVDGRIIDLSHAAAREIGMIGPGTARVRLTLIGYGPPREIESAFEAGAFAVQAGAFASRANAEAMKERLERKFHPVRVVEREGSQTPWRVLVGEKPSEQEAKTLAEQLKSEAGVEGFVVRVGGPS